MMLDQNGRGRGKGSMRSAEYWEKRKEANAVTWSVITKHLGGQNVSCWFFNKKARTKTQTWPVSGRETFWEPGAVL